MNELVKVKEECIAGETVLVVDAREVWEYLEVESFFPHWISRRIKQARLQENIEYVEFLSKPTKTSSGGRPSKNYYLTLRGAELITQMEKTDKGDEFRRYLLDFRDKHVAMQKQANELMDVMDDELVQTIVRVVRLERRFNATEESVMMLEQKHKELQEANEEIKKTVNKVIHNDKMYTVDGYLRIKKLYMDDTERSKFGKRLTMMSPHLKKEINEIMDPYRGYPVNTYHIEVFKAVLKSMGYKNIF